MVELCYYIIYAYTDCELVTKLAGGFSESRSVTYNSNCTSCFETDDKKYNLLSAKYRRRKALTCSLIRHRIAVLLFI
jgi:hypothetical protein